VRSTFAVGVLIAGFAIGLAGCGSKDASSSTGRTVDLIVPLALGAWIFDRRDW
jgi:hypothetical protein